MSTPDTTCEVETDEPSLSRWRKFLRFFMRPRPWYWKTLGILAGAVIPVLCFAATRKGGSPLVLDEWQSGEFNQYTNQMLQWPSVGPFYPLLGYCILCCCLVLLGGQRWVNKIWVRFGIYTGVPIAIQYHFLLFAPSKRNPVFFIYSFLSLVLLAFATLVLLVLIASIMSLLGKLWKKLGAVGFLGAMLTLAVLRSIIVFLNLPSGSSPARVLVPIELAFVVPIAMVGSTVFAVLTYTVLSWRVWRDADDRRFRFGLLPMMGGLTWSAGYLAAWRSSVLMAIEQYEKLPVTQPQCYVCTAAAQGHRHVVKSFAVTPSDGQSMTINRQLQVLKAAELMLIVTAPKTHRKMRWVYDLVGPRLALCLRSAWLADVAYLVLKMVELPAAWLMSLAGVDELTSRLYRGQQRDSRRD